jgi:hypothetical protein
MPNEISILEVTSGTIKPKIKLWMLKVEHNVII